MGGSIILEVISVAPQYDSAASHMDESFQHYLGY